VILPDKESPENKPTPVEETQDIDELSGKMAFSGMDDKFMHAVVENDEEKIDEGNLIRESLNQGISSFTPSNMFEQMVQNFSMAKQLFGETIIRSITGYDPNYIEKNIRVPEFRKEIKKAIEEKIKQLKKDKILDESGAVTEEGIELAALVMAAEELDNLIPKGIFGERVNKKESLFGFKEEYLDYKKGARYREIAIRRSLKVALRRGHTSIHLKDLKVYDKEARGQNTIIYAIDASGSMKGKKIDASKRAGIALAYKAIQERDKVGLIVFGDEIKVAISPTQDFTKLLKEIVRVKASKETDLAIVLDKANSLFTESDESKHLLILTDAVPTVGNVPEKMTIEASLRAKEAGITISIVGINLDEQGKKLAEKIVEIGQGRLYIVKDVEELDKIILEDYYAVAGM